MMGAIHTRNITRVMGKVGYKWKKGNFDNLLQVIKQYLRDKGIVVDNGH